MNKRLRREAEFVSLLTFLYLIRHLTPVVVDDEISDPKYHKLREA